MNVKLICVLTALSGLVASGAQAADSKADKRDCVFARAPQSWRVLDQKHLVVWAPTQKDAYLIELMAPLQDIQFSETLAFIDGDHNGMICGDGGDQIAVPNSKVSSWPATIISMHHLNDDELKALGEQYHLQLGPKPQVKTHDKQAHE